MTRETKGVRMRTWYSGLEQQVTVCDMKGYLEPNLFPSSGHHVFVSCGCSVSSGARDTHQTHDLSSGNSSLIEPLLYDELHNDSYE